MQIGALLSAFVLSKRLLASLFPEIFLAELHALIVVRVQREDALEDLLRFRHPSELWRARGCRGHWRWCQNLFKVRVASFGEAVDNARLGRAFRSDRQGGCATLLSGRGRGRSRAR